MSRLPEHKLLITSQILMTPTLRLNWNKEGLQVLANFKCLS